MKLRKWKDMCLLDKLTTTFFTATGVGCAALTPLMPLMAAPAAMALSVWVEKEEEDEDPDGSAPHNWAKRSPLHDGHDGPGFD